MRRGTPQPTIWITAIRRLIIIYIYIFVPLPFLYRFDLIFHLTCLRCQKKIKLYVENRIIQFGIHFSCKILTTAQWIKYIFTFSEMNLTMCHQIIQMWFVNNVFTRLLLDNLCRNCRILNKNCIDLHVVVFPYKKNITMQISSLLAEWISRCKVRYDL